MKIKNQFIITILTFALVLIIVNLSVFFTLQQAADLANQQDIAGNIQYESSHLSHISNDYFLHQDLSGIANWQSNISAINRYVSELSINNAQQAQIVNTLREDIRKVDTSFNDTTVYLQNAPRNQSVRIQPEFQIVWGQLTDNIQSLSNDSAQLSQLLRNESDQAHQSNIYLIVILLVVFAVYFFVNYLITYRTTLKSVAELQAGIKRIGSGNLDFSIKKRKNDEVGDLANSINQMTAHLKDLTIKLKEQERMAAIGQTAGMVGHDLRNPLQTISGEVYLAKNELQHLPQGELKSSMQESVDAIEEQILYMDKIVSDLQAFVKPVEAHKEVFNLRQSVVARLAEVNVPKNVKTQIEIDENLEIDTDSQLLKRVLINLITNSVQAMPEGGQLSIEAQVEDGAKVKISVEDTGVGIPDEVKPNLFTPLFTTKSKGQGFGLAVCKRVIEAQGGTITFESSIGKGTKFMIELPWSQTSKNKDTGNKN